MKITKAILTGGGRATRLRPVTTTTNKHLLPLANKPMIFHAIEKVVDAGITEIFINTNPGETELQSAIGDGSRWGVSITFFEQTGGPQGIAHVVNEAHEFIGDDPFIFYLSDNILLGSIREMVQEFEQGNTACMLALSEVPDPERFGVPVFDANGKLIDVWEKPAVPPNRFAVTGMYLYGPKVFFETFAHIERSARGEYEISSIHSEFLKRGYPVGYKEITGWWKDTGKPDDLLAANKLLFDAMPKHQFVFGGVAGAVTITGGPVHAGEGTRFLQGVKIIGPVIIGDQCVLGECTIGPYVSIASGADIHGATIANSIILDSATIHGDIVFADSILGKSVVLQKKSTHHDSGRAPQKMILGDKTMICW